MAVEILSTPVRSRYQLLERALGDLGHPVRLQILSHLAVAPASPKAIAEMSEASLGTVAYHVRAMLDDGLILLDRERRVRGAVEHFYRLSARGRRLHAELLGDGT